MIRLTLLALGLLNLAPGEVAAQSMRHGPKAISAPVTARVFEGDLRDLPAPPNSEWQPGDPITVVPKRYEAPKARWNAAPPLPGRLDPLIGIQQRAETRRSGNVTELSANLEGIITTATPPDPVGAVGLKYFIESVNSAGAGATIRVIDKESLETVADFQMASLATGGLCTQTRGDPIVIYDELAQRFVLLEFNPGQNTLCTYVARSQDPISDGWYAYEFVQSALPDYPKIAVWPTAYVATINVPGGAPQVLAWDRQAMLVGEPATQQTFVPNALSGYGFQALTPATHVGADPPPAGAAAVLMRHVDDEPHSPGSFLEADPEVDFLEVFHLDLDWDLPESSTLELAQRLEVPDFNSWLPPSNGANGYGTFSSIPQPSSFSRLDAIREVIMHPLVYRVIGDIEVLVGNHVTNEDPATEGNVVDAGIRWFVVERRRGGGWRVGQIGTFGGDDAETNHWLGASAIDQRGNVGLLYNATKISEPTLFAGLWVSGRSSDAADGVLDVDPIEVIEGQSAFSLSERWGDYASMSVDPVDGCTFWGVGEYVGSGGTRTRITSFAFDDCACQIADFQGPSVQAEVAGDNRIVLRWADAPSAEVRDYRVLRSAGSGFVSLALVSDRTPGIGAAGDYRFVDAEVSGGSSYDYLVSSSDGRGCRALSEPIEIEAEGVCTLEPAFAGLEFADSADTEVCAIELGWSAASSACGASIDYALYRSIDPGFEPSAGNLVAEGLAGLSHVDRAGLLWGRDYHYILRAVDQSAGAERNELRMVAHAQAATQVFGDAIAYSALSVAEAAGWSHGAEVGLDDWAIGAGQQGNALVSADVDTVTDKWLSITVGTVAADQQLIFSHAYHFEEGFDGGVLEISTDGGESWEDVGEAIVAGGYDRDLSTAWENPIGGRAAWSATTESFIETVIDLGAWAGSELSLRWRMGCDSGVGGGLWQIDEVFIGRRFACRTESSDGAYEDLGELDDSTVSTLTKATEKD